MLKGYNLFVLWLGFMLAGCGQVVNYYHGASILSSARNKLIVGKTTRQESIKLLGPATFADSLLPNVEVYVSYTKKEVPLGQNKLRDIEVSILKFDSKQVLVKLEHTDLEKLYKISHSNEATKYDIKARYDILSQIGRALLSEFTEGGMSKK